MTTTEKKSASDQKDLSSPAHACCPNACCSSMLGDCDRRGCGHSIAYHVPLAGCLKCSCDEYR